MNASPFDRIVQVVAGSSEPDPQGDIQRLVEASVLNTKPFSALGELGGLEIQHDIPDAFFVAVCSAILTINICSMNRGR